MGGKCERSHSMSCTFGKNQGPGYYFLITDYWIFSCCHKVGFFRHNRDIFLWIDYIFASA